MNLPFIVDVAIGLVFIYLILSLLSSEIQEILATILQWRAAHLKKSIEILLMGDTGRKGNAVKLAQQGIFKPAELAQDIAGQLRITANEELQNKIEQLIISSNGTATERAKYLVDELEKLGLLGNQTKQGTDIYTTLEDAFVLEELHKAKLITNTIYNNPLVRNISQESREGFEGLIRSITRAVITLWGKRRTTLKHGNEPSYIPSETFATTLLEILHVPQFTRRLTALNLKILVQDQIVSDVEEAVKKYQEQGKNQKLNEFIGAGFDNFKQKINLVLKAFADERITLQMSIGLLKGEFIEYVTKAEQIRKNLASHSASKEPVSKEIERSQAATQDLAAFDGFVSQLNAIRQLVFYDDPQRQFSSTDEMIRQLQPTVAQVMKAFSSDLQSVNQKYQRFTNRSSLREDPAFQSGYKEIITLYDEIQRDAQAIAQKLPAPVRESLDALAQRAQINLDRTNEQISLVQGELYQFKSEIEKWFDDSMERASGVYKRNSKGVGFLIGLTIALAINADTVHIARQLSSNSTLRQALISSAETVTQSCPKPLPPPATTPLPAAPVPPITEPVPPAANPPTSRLFFEQPAFAQAAPTAAPVQPVPQSDDPLNCIEQAVEDATALPLGWSKENKAQQMDFVDGKPKDPSTWGRIWRQITRLIGWIVSGLAISMGAAFWFELLSKLVNVRNTGNRPNKSSGA